MSAVLIPDETEIRRMHDSDLKHVIHIERRSYPFPWSEGVFRDCLRVGYNCSVLEHQHRPGGYLILSMAAGEAHVLNLCVDPALQGCGHGHALLEYGLYTAARMGAENMFLEVRPSNTPAVTLYEGMGFVEVGVRPGYYPRPGKTREDALIMARVLNPPPAEP